MRLKTKVKSFYRHYLDYRGALRTLISVIMLLVPLHNVLVELMIGGIVLCSLYGWGYERSAHRLKRLLTVTEYKRLRTKKVCYENALKAYKVVEAEFNVIGREYNIPSEEVQKYIDTTCETIIKMGKRV